MASADLFRTWKTQKSKRSIHWCFYWTIRMILVKPNLWSLKEDLSKIVSVLSDHGWPWRPVSLNNPSQFLLSLESPSRSNRKGPTLDLTPPSKSQTLTSRTSRSLPKCSDSSAKKADQISMMYSHEMFQNSALVRRINTLNSASTRKRSRCSLDCPKL